jgi:amino acid adenylation domain-containing protein
MLRDLQDRRLPLTPGDHRMLVEWNATQRAWPGGQCAHRLIAAQVERTPDAPAVALEGRAWSYRELDRRANRLARRLRSLGVEADRRVAVCLDRTPALVAATLGVMKAGGAYLPLDPAYPPERLAFMVEDAGVTAIVTEPALRGRIPASGGAELLMDGGALEDGDDRPPDDRVDDGDLAYVIYTSGSTGRPKGVQIPHRALANFLQSMRERPGLAAGDVVLAVTTLSFDIAALELYLPLVVGARVELASRAVATDGRRLREALARSGATLMQATPATWRMLIAAGWTGDAGLTALCGGEALSPELARELKSRTRALWNMYGPTETTVWSTLHEVGAVEGPVPIGRPIANTTLYIVDAHLQPVPVGADGELYIGGAGVARGYLGRPELTAERFIEDPFQPGAGARLYRTGDLARYRADGTVECLGRADRQVKIRGFRVEPGEIESALLAQEGVRQAAVVARDDGRGTRRLAAYVVLDPLRPPSSVRLRDALRGTLAAHMVPSWIVPLEAFPLTPNGKLDVLALPAAEELPAAAHEEAVAPRDDVERRLARVWAGVLGREPAGIREDFFDAGGDSLMAVGLFVEIEQAFGRNLPLATLLDAPTVEALAAVLRDHQGPPGWSPLVAIQPAGTRPPFFCVHGVGGNVLNYRALSRYLGEDQPFYGLQARGLDGTETPLTRIEDMAAAYLAAVRAVQPKGPYALGGASFGGNVALEMARRLAAEGEDVRLVALFDTYPAGYEHLVPAGRDTVAHGLAARLRVHAQVLAHGPDRALYFRKKARRVFRRTLYRAWQAAFAAFRSLGRPLPAALRRVQHANYKALRDYAPPRYPGPVAFFSATGEPPDFKREKRAGWTVLAEEVDVQEVPGDHLTMMEEPHVRTLAARLAACLDRAAASS